MTELRTLYPPIEPYETGRLDVGDGHSLYWERCGNPGRQAGRLPPRRPRRRLQPRPSPPVRSRRATTSCCSTSAAAAARRPHAVARGQHDLAPGRRHRAAARAWPAHERWMVFGGSWGSTLALAYAADPSGAGHRAGAARHLHLPPDRARLALPLRRVRGLSGQMGGLPRADPRGGARTTWSPPISGASPIRRPGDPARRGQGVEPVGGGDRHPAAQPGDDRRSTPATISPSPSPGSRIIIWSIAAGSRKAS